MSKQKAVQEFKPFFTEKKQESGGEKRGAGHKFWCDSCEEFRVKAMDMVGNGTPKMQSLCRTCGKTEMFIKAAGFWIPESVLDTLDEFAEATIDAKVKKMWEEAEVEEAVKDIETSDDDEKTKMLKNQLALWKKIKGGEKSESDEASEHDEALGETRRERLRSWMTCSRYLLVVSPLIAGLGLLGALGLLAYNGVYVHPIYEWIAPYWRPWMNSIWLTYGPIIGAVALIVGYVRCRLVNRTGKVSGIAEEMEQNENSILGEIDDF